MENNTEKEIAFLNGAYIAIVSEIKELKKQISHHEKLNKNLVLLILFQFIIQSGFTIFCVITAK